MTTHIVTGDQYSEINKRMKEIKRQLNQEHGSPLYPEAVLDTLQQIIEGDFSGERTIAQLIVAGNYDWWNQDINGKNFPIAPRNRDEYNLELIQFEKRASEKKILEDLASKGLEIADIVDLLEFGEKYPEEQKRFIIREIGSAWTNPEGEKHVVVLGMIEGKRILQLFVCHDEFGGESERILVRRKKSV